MLLGDWLPFGISSSPSSRCSRRAATQNAVSCVVRREAGGARGEGRRWAGCNLANNTLTYSADQAMRKVRLKHKPSTPCRISKCLYRRPRLYSVHVWHSPCDGNKKTQRVMRLTYCRSISNCPVFVQLLLERHKIRSVARHELVRAGVIRTGQKICTTHLAIKGGCCWPVRVG